MNRVNGEIAIKPVGILAKNLITFEGQASLITALTSGTVNPWSYIAVGLGTSTPGSAQTALDEEIYRIQVDAIWSPNPGTAKLIGVFPAGVATGRWREFGIFDNEAARHSLHTCESAGDWTSDGSLFQETTIVNQGGASLGCTMNSTGTIAFSTTNLGTSSGTAYTYGTSDYLQFWYYTTHNVGTLTIQFGASESDCFEFHWDPGTVNTWVHFHQQLGTVRGPWTFGTTDSYFRITHSAQGTTFYEYLDWISLFQKNGTMLSRGTIDSEKGYNEVWNIYYTIRVNT